MSGVDPNAGGALVVGGGGVPTTRTVAGAPLSADIPTATIATALGLGAVTATGANAAAARTAIGAASAATTVAGAALSGDVSTTTLRTALGVVAPTRYGNQTGGDTTWAGWTLGSGVAVTAGALRMTNDIGTTTVPLAGLASSRAVRMEWHPIPISGWSDGADIIYCGLARGALAQYWLHRCMGDGRMTPWIEQPAADRQDGSGNVDFPGPTIATSTTWMALEVSGGYFTIQYGTGTGTGGRTPPAPSEWKTYGSFATATYTGTASVQAEDLVRVIQQGTCVVDMDALTIIPLSPVVS